MPDPQSEARHRRRKASTLTLRPGWPVKARQKAIRVRLFEG
jgi:hypothetical protein